MEPTLALIIDDDKDTANLFRTILELVGFECQAAYSAKSALAYLAVKDPDIVLLDLRLGLELDGKDILYQIRSNPRLDKTRVIVITAYPGMLEQVDSLADLMLIKPVEIEDLTTLVSRLTQTRPKSYLFRDPVSGLYTLNFFMTRLEHTFERARRKPDLLFGMLAIEFTVSSEANEQLQEEDCEKILKQVAEILNRDFRPTDTFGTIAGLRVAALYEDFKKPEDIHTVIQRLHNDLTLAVEVRGCLWRVTPIIGAVLNNPRFQSPDEILKAAVNTLERACELTGEFYLIADPPQT
jgi:PleD family two-component response regulator